MAMMHMSMDTMQMNSILKQTDAVYVNGDDMTAICVMAVSLSSGSDMLSWSSYTYKGNL